MSSRGHRHTRLMRNPIRARSSFLLYKDDSPLTREFSLSLPPRNSFNCRGLRFHFHLQQREGHRIIYNNVYTCVYRSIRVVEGSARGGHTTSGGGGSADFNLDYGEHSSSQLALPIHAPAKFIGLYTCVCITHVYTRHAARNWVLPDYPEINLYIHIGIDGFICSRFRITEWFRPIARCRCRCRF